MTVAEVILELQKHDPEKVLYSWGDRVQQWEPVAQVVMIDQPGEVILIID